MIISQWRPRLSDYYHVPLNLITSNQCHPLSFSITACFPLYFPSNWRVFYQLIMKERLNIYIVSRRHIKSLLFCNSDMKIWELLYTYIAPSSFIRQYRACRNSRRTVGWFTGTICYNFTSFNTLVKFFRYYTHLVITIRTTTFMHVYFVKSQLKLHRIDLQMCVFRALWGSFHSLNAVLNTY